MNTFDPSASGNRERPAPDDPEAPFYPPYTPVDHQDGPQSGPSQPHHSGPFHHQHHYGYGPDDPDGYARPYGGWRGGPQPWQPWAWQGHPWRRHRGPHLWKFALLLLLLILFIKPALAFTFALAGLALTILLVLLPFIILGMIFGRHYGWQHHWGHHGWGHHGWHHRGGPWDRGW